MSIKLLPTGKDTSPLSKAVIHNGLVYVSGQAPLDPKTREATSPDFREQMRETLHRIDEILAEAGTSREKLLMVRVYLPHVKRDFGAMNEEYMAWLGDYRPARTTIGAALAIDSLQVEIDCVAAVE